MKVKVEGKCDISATIVCDSVSPTGVRLTTMELTYPRLIHSELKTHRVFSSNSASSRAIPFEKMLKQLNGRPVRFGAANKGMQDNGEFSSLMRVPFENGLPQSKVVPEIAWEMAKESAIEWASTFYKNGLAKQVYNRLIEPFQTMKTVVSATEWSNFFHLRLDSAADPTIQELARCMKEATDKSVPQGLRAGEWHLPYVSIQGSPGGAYYCVGGEDTLLEYAIKVSAARCAAVSFRNEDYGLEKCLEVYDRLVGDERVHASALEHQATPISDTTLSFVPDDWEQGITNVDVEGNLWSGNFRGFIQYRQLVPNHVKK